MSGDLEEFWHCHCFMWEHSPILSKSIICNLCHNRYSCIAFIQIDNYGYILHVYILSSMPESTNSCSVVGSLQKAVISGQMPQPPMLFGRSPAMNGLSPTERELPEDLGALEFLMKLRRRDETQTPFKEFKFRSCHKKRRKKTSKEAIFQPKRITIMILMIQLPPLL